MAYSTNNNPQLVAQSEGKTGGNIWFYTSTDNATVVGAAGYITDGVDLGIKEGDVVRTVDTDASPVVMTEFVVTNIQSNGSVDLTAV